MLRRLNTCRTVGLSQDGVAQPSAWVVVGSARQFPTYEPKRAGAPDIVVDPRNTSRCCPERLDRQGQSQNPTDVLLNAVMPPPPISQPPGTSEW